MPPLLKNPAARAILPPSARSRPRPARPLKGSLSTGVTAGRLRSGGGGQKAIADLTGSDGLLHPMEGLCAHQDARQGPTQIPGGVGRNLIFLMRPKKLL